MKKHLVLLLGFISIFVFVFYPSKALPFDLGRHWEMTRQVLDEDFTFPQPFKYAILEGTAGSDIFDGLQGYCADPYCPPTWLIPTPSAPDIITIFSPRHFDNCNNAVSLERGINFVNSMIVDARSSIIAWHSSPGPTNTIHAWGAIVRAGRAIHALQDFYAHSNYVEIHNNLYFGVDQIPLWQGEGYSDITHISNDAGIADLSGLQTGFVLLAIPDGSTTHDILNKDKPNTPEGETSYYNLFGDPIWTKYRVVSGQFLGTGWTDPYTVGLAPRHTYIAMRSLQFGSNVFDEYPPTLSRIEPDRDYNILPLINELAGDPLFIEISVETSNILSRVNPNDQYSFPIEFFESDTGLPYRYVNGGFLRRASEEIAFSGGYGGPFSPSCYTITLHNATSGPIEWTSSYSESWGAVTPAQGVIAISDSVSVEICLTQEATELVPGDYSGTCIVENNVSGLGVEISATLSISSSIGVPDTEPTDTEPLLDVDIAPNPFNPVANIRLVLPFAGNVKLHLLDSTGRVITALLDSRMEGGAYDFRWFGVDSRGVPMGSGVYFCRLDFGGRHVVKKLLLLR